MTSAAASSSLAGARVLVTGASGLVGRALVRALVHEGAQITALSRRPLEFDSASDGVSVVVVAGFGADLVRGAVRGCIDVGGRFDVVFHLGAAGVKPTEHDPVDLVAGNIGVTAAVLAALDERAPARFVFAGSSAQYGVVDAPHRLRESDVQAPSSLYGAAKVAAEQYGAALAAKLAVPFVSMRLFGVYGPGESPHRFLPYLARSLARGERPALTPGGQARDWIFVDDVARALVVAATAPLTRSAYNVCSGVGVSVGDVAKKIGAAVGTGEEALGLGARPYRSDEPMWIVGDPSALRDDTGFVADTSLDDGVARSVAWALQGAAP